VYALIAVSICAGLGMLSGAARAWYGRAIDQSLPPLQPGSLPTDAMFAAAEAENTTLWVVQIAAWVLAFAAQLGVAFWVGRKSSPAWYWGLSVGLTTLPTGWALAVALSRAVSVDARQSTGYLLIALAAWLLSLALIALSAYLGGCPHWRREISGHVAP
jgi:F0F1-type ATP synthase membrane subunit c/vacuolar-type H+-ATPase subunit K